MDPSPQPVEIISAITLKTLDMAGAVAFYRALEFPLVHGGPDAEFTSLRAGSSFVNLQLDRGAGPPPTGWGRIILWVDDVDAMHRRCLAAGFSPLTAPRDAPWGERYFHIRDADGHELSFARPLERLSDGDR